MNNETKPSISTISRLLLGGVLVLGALFVLLYVYAFEQPIPIFALQNNHDSVVKETKFNKSQPEKSNTCSEMVDQTEDLSRIKDVRNTWLRSYFMKLVRLNIGQSQLEMLAERAGISPLDSKAVLPKKSALFVTQEELRNGLERASVDETKKLLSLVADNELAYVAMHLGADSDRKLYSGIPFFTFVLHNSSDKSPYLLSELYSQGFNPTLFDLAMTLTLNPEDHVVSGLVQEIDVSSDNWPVNGNTQVTLMLASMFLPDALSLWVNKTQAEHDPATRGDVLDFLPTPKKVKQTEAVQTIEILLDVGQRIQTRLGYHHLMTWLPRDWVAANESRLVLPVGNLEPETESHLVELETKLAEYMTRIEKTNQIIALCPIQVERSIAKRKRSLEGTTISDREKQFQDRAQEFKPVSALQILAKAPMDASLGVYRDKLVETLLDRKWQDIFEILPLFTQTEHADVVMDAIMSHAVVSNAPYEIFERLLETGASLPGNSLALMSVLGHLDLTARLITRGLDMNFVDPIGLNALGSIILNADRKPSVFNPLFPVLLEAGVDAKPIGASLDPLNFALQRITTAGFTAEYAKQLIAHGAPIEFSHIQQMQALKLTDEAIYLELISYIPELGTEND